MPETAKTLPLRPLSQRQLLPRLRELIDLLMDPEAKESRTDEWCNTYIKLHSLIQKPGVWAVIDTVQPGNRTTYLQNGLGTIRMDFLRRFRELTRG